MQDGKIDFKSSADIVPNMDLSGPIDKIVYKKSENTAVICGRKIILIIFSEKSQVHWMATKWPWMLKVKATLYMFYYWQRVLNFPFRSTIARFPDNWDWFHKWNNSEIEIFEK